MTDDPQKQGKKSKLGAYISFFVRNEAAGTAMKRRTVIDSNNEAHEAVTMSWSWRDTWQEEHKRAFVVAKMAKADLLTEVHDSLQKALDDGQSFEHWRKEIVPKLESKWLGKTVGQLWDELSDEEKAKREPPSDEQREKVIAPERLELIFRTNMAVANAAGHYSQLMKTKDIYPYWRYVTRDDARVRTSHRALHNKVYKWDDPFWQTFFPPNGFRCRCHVSPMTKRQVERDPLLHIEQSNIAEGADGRKVLDVGGYYYQNNPGWDYNPGDSINHLERLAKDNKKGRPAQVQADLVADLAKREAEEAVVAKQRKSEGEKLRQAVEDVVARSDSNVQRTNQTAGIKLDNYVFPQERKVPKEAYVSSKETQSVISLIKKIEQTYGTKNALQRLVGSQKNGTAYTLRSPFSSGDHQSQNNQSEPTDSNADERLSIAKASLKKTQNVDLYNNGVRILEKLAAANELPNYTSIEVGKSIKGEPVIIFHKPGYKDKRQARKALRRYKKYEHAIIFKSNECVMEISTACENSITFPHGVDYSGSNVLHNHPNGKFFSLDDVATSVDKNFQDLEAVSPIKENQYSLINSNTQGKHPLACADEYFNVFEGILEQHSNLPVSEQHSLLKPFIISSKYFNIIDDDYEN